MLEQGRMRVSGWNRPMTKEKAEEKEERREDVAPSSPTNQRS